MVEKMYAILVDPKKEEKIRKKVLTILGRQKNNPKYRCKRSHLHKMVGCGIRAAYFKYILETMHEEKLIMPDYRDAWALWDAQSSIALRAQWEQRRIEREERQRQWEASPAGIAERERQEARLAQEFQQRLIRDLSYYFVDFEEEIFDMISKLICANLPKKSFLSAITNQVGKTQKVMQNW